jgi:transposase InsO family protein
MPWKETCVMDERLAFVTDYLRGAMPMTALCTHYGISRKTGYKWAARFLEGGPPGLADRSRARHSQSARMASSVAEAILALRRSRPFWGPRKLRALLMRQAPETAWPAASTIGDLLRAHGLSQARRRRRRAIVANRPFRAAEAPNDVWCIDFKGWFRTGDGQRCDPLTITDAHSRYVLACQIVPPFWEPVRAVVERTFRTYGLPKAMRSDNGPPFAANSAGGLTRLSLGWVKVGIELERIAPGKPQQNGRHERFHRTLKAETSRPPAGSPREQQARFDAFCLDFNENRPHEALDQEPPASVYRASPRPWRAVLEDPWYDADHAVRKVRSSGEIKWAGRSVFISETLAGEMVGLAEVGEHGWLVRFADIDLGLIDQTNLRFTRFTAARPCRRESKPNKNTVTHVTGP